VNYKEHLLTCLIEEAAEIQQAATKALRFGLQDGYPGSNTTNAQDIAREINDLIAVIDLCRENGIISQPAESKHMYEAKRERVKKYMDVAKRNGALTG
jgi:NTP pyrophosphatase (non-canonical NTP hydrolase)